MFSLHKLHIIPTFHDNERKQILTSILANTYLQCYIVYEHPHMIKLVVHICTASSFCHVYVCMHLACVYLFVCSVCVCICVFCMILSAMCVCSLYDFVCCVCIYL